MPTASERATNKPLSGEEVKRLLTDDFLALLDADGMLQPHLAYGRISWQIRLTLHTGNPVVPESVSTAQSRQPSAQAIAAQPALASVLPWMSGQATSHLRVTAADLTRKIVSPNAERIRTGLPVPVDVKQTDGTMITQSIKYPADPAQGSSPVIADASPDPRPDWGQLDEVQEVVIPDVGSTPIPTSGLAPLTDEQVAAQSARINEIFKEKIAAMTPEEEEKLNAAFGGQS